jgi:hypothetical protein
VSGAQPEASDVISYLVKEKKKEKKKRRKKRKKKKQRGKELQRIHTIPHLLTVAGEAFSNPSSSKINLMFLVMAITSPLVKHNFMLSSNTLFIST